MTAASGADHSLRYRVVDFGTLYDCECGDFTEAADPTDEDHRRVYEAHAAHIRAASGAHRDVCACGHDVTDHGTGPVGCIHRDGCSTFASGADQPTLRDTAAVLRRLIDTAPVMRFNNDYPVKAVPIAELLDVLLPLIEADRERAKAEGGAEALDLASMDKSLPGIFPSTVAWLRDRAAALRGSTGGAR